MKNTSTELPALSVTYKRNSRCRTVLRRTLSDNWTVADGQAYAKAMSENTPDVDIMLWTAESINSVWRNGHLA